jgi:type II secretory pathway pseudopilin PulG
VRFVGLRNDPDSASGRLRTNSGYAMAALLVGMAVMAVVLSAAMPVWSTQSKRIKEDELIFRGEQYARAIMLYQRKYANALPPSIDVLVNERFLRKKYLDPITGEDFQPLTGAVGANAPNGGSSGGTTTPGRSGGSTSGSSSAGASGGRTSAFGPSSGSQGQQQTASFGRGTSGGGMMSAVSTGPGSGRTSSTGFGGAGGIAGVTSKSKEKSLRLYNGRDVYNEWNFVPVQRTQQAGGGEGSATPGGGRGQPTPGPGSRGSGSRGFSSGPDSFRPNSGGFGSTGGFRSGGSPGR